MEQKQEPRMLTVGEAAALLPARNPGAHKGNFGRLLIVAGSAGYTGAAALCTLAALRMGAGIVTLASVLPVLAAAQAKLYEPTFLTLPDNGAGQIARAGRGAAARAGAVRFGASGGLWSWPFIRRESPDGRTAARCTLSAAD